MVPTLRRRVPPKQLSDLDHQTLGRIFGCLPPEIRASVVSLVSKTWLAVEQDNAPQPNTIVLDTHVHFTESRLAWELRSPGRLTRLEIANTRNGETSQVEKGCSKILTQLSKKAPDLRCLHMQAAVLDLGPFDEMRGNNFLFPFDCVAKVAQLTELRLSKWSCWGGSSVNISCLGQLSNLKVLSLIDIRQVLMLAVLPRAQRTPQQVAYDNAPKLNGDRMHDILRNLVRLTMLELRDLGGDLNYMLGPDSYPRPGSIYVPPASTANLVNLRSLTVTGCFIRSYGGHGRNGSLSNADLSAVAAMTNLLSLEMDAPSGHLGSLFTRLAALKDLDVSYYGEDPPSGFDVADGASLTSLRLVPRDGTVPVTEAEIKLLLPLDKLTGLARLELVNPEHQMFDPGHVDYESSDPDA